MPHTPKAISAHVNETIIIRKILKYSANLLTNLIIDLFWNSLQSSIRPWPTDLNVHASWKLLWCGFVWPALACTWVDLRRLVYKFDLDQLSASLRTCILGPTHVYTRPAQASKPASIYNSVWRRINCFIIPSLNIFLLAFTVFFHSNVFYPWVWLMQVL